MARSTTRISAILLLGCLLAGLDTLVWLGMQHELSRTLRRAADASIGAGWQMATTAATRGGWPFAATLTTNLRLAGHHVAWSGERIELSMAIWRPRRITLLARGAQILSLDGAGGGPAGGNIADSLRVRAGRIAVHLPVSWREGRMIRFDGDAVQMALPAAGRTLDLKVAHLEGWVRWTAQATAVTLAVDKAVWTGGGEIPSARVQASLIGRPARLLLSDAELRWPDALISLSGDAWFARAWSAPPVGRFSARVVGAGALLDREAAVGGLTPSSASAIRAVLGLIAQAGGTQAGGAEAGVGQAGAATRIAIPPLDLPLGLHDGWLWLGRIPLWQIGWPPVALP